MIKHFLPALLVGILLGGSAWAYESPVTTLGGAVGATDYYRLTCADGTHHLDFQVSQTEPLDSGTAQQNARIVKNGIVAEALAVTPGKTGVASLSGGNGKYRVTVDTKGSAAAVKQAYSLGFQCLNAAGQSVKTSVTSASGTVKGRPKSVSVSCKGKGAGGVAERLLVNLSNTTKSGQTLIAQVVKGFVALSTADGLDATSLPGGAGDYYMTVSQTGTNAGADRLYVYKANCLDVANAESGEPDVSQLQDNATADR